MKATLVKLCVLLLINICHADTLTIFNWEEYLSEDTIKAWETKTGHTVKEVYFDNDEARDSYLVKAGFEGIDIAIMDEPASQLFGENHKFVKVTDYENVDNLRHIDSFWKNRCGSYSIPYLWGTVGLAYRKDIFETSPNSWNALLQPTESLKGHISYLKDSIDTFAPALFALGYSVNTENKAELREAFKLTKKITKDLLTLEYPVTYVSANKRANELHLAVVYSGDQWSMNLASESELWHYVVPKEGTILWVDCFAVLQKSKNKTLAFDFINYINHPEVAARNSESLYVATTNNAAKKLQSDDFLNDETIYPPQNIINNSQYYEQISSGNDRLRNRMATSLLTIYESK